MNDTQKVLSAIAELNKRMDGFEEKLDAVASKVKDLPKIKANIGKIKDDVATLKTDVTEIKDWTQINIAKVDYSRSRKSNVPA